MKFRVQPQAVCRQLLSQLDRHKRLSHEEEMEVLAALQKTGVSTERILADLARSTIRNLLGQLSTDLFFKTLLN